MKKRLFSLRKSRATLLNAFSLYKKKGDTLTLIARETLENLLATLDTAIHDRDREKASSHAQEVQSFVTSSFPRTIFSHLKEIAVALVFALIIATVIRQMWFEPMEIPTGSMRPTIMEKDRLIVHKTTFGLNVPLLAEHFFFDASRVKRTSIIIFRPENINMSDTSTTYFGIPGKKRYIKRCIGKPGDTLYFYGGKIYGIDSDGNEIHDLLDAPWMDNLEHIPFIKFEGKLVPAHDKSSLLLYQSGKPLGKISFLHDGSLSGEIFDGKIWKKDKLFPSKRLPKTSIQSYRDFFGFKNYALARLLTKKEVINYSHASLKDAEENDLYLELRHSPSLSHLSSLDQRNISSSSLPYISWSTSILPIAKSDLQTIMGNMYTARFVVKDGYAIRYSYENRTPEHHPQNPSFPTIPNGTYEFYHGKAYSIGWGGVATLLAEDHPLYDTSPLHVQTLYNLGIEMHTAFSPHHKNQNYYPSRYAYYREGALHLLGAQLFDKDHPTLQALHEKEKNASMPFIDHGPPLNKDRSFDKKFISMYGLHIPKESYFLLGDNHAMSSDSRDFGFVPEKDIRGSAGPLLWSPGPRWGHPSHPHFSWITPSTCIVWAIFIIVATLSYLYARKKEQYPIFKKKEFS
jgi:signal peptidase I